MLVLHVGSLQASKHRTSTAPSRAAPRASSATTDTCFKMASVVRVHSLFFSLSLFLSRFLFSITLSLYLFILPVLLFDARYLTCVLRGLLYSSSPTMRVDQQLCDVFRIRTKLPKVRPWLYFFIRVLWYVVFVRLSSPHYFDSLAS